MSGTQGNHRNDEDNGNPGCKPWVPQTTGLGNPTLRCGQMQHDIACWERKTNIDLVAFELLVARLAHISQNSR